MVRDTSRNPVIVFVLFGVAFFGFSVPAGSVRMQGSFRSHLYLRQDRLVDPLEEYFLPARQYLNLHLTEFAGPNWSFHGAGWIRQDLARRSDFTHVHADKRFEADLSYGYLEWRDPRRPDTYAKFGRQYVFWGGVYERFDGLTFSKEFESGNGIAVFGGIPTFSDYGGRSDDEVYGGRFWLRPFQSSELGFSYVHREDDGDLDREVFNQDFFWRPLHWVELEQHLSYDTITDEIVELGLYGAFQFHPKAKFSISYDQAIPGALLPQTSILSVYSNDEIQELALGLDYYPCPDWRLWTEAVYFDSRSPGGQNFRYRVEGAGYWEYRLGTRYYYGDDASLSLELRHLDVPEQGIEFVEGDDRFESIDNGYDRLRFTNHRWLNQWCWQSFEAGATFYRDDVNGSPHSFDVSSTWGYRPRKQLEAVATVRYIDSAVDNTEFQALLSVTYWFDKRMKGGATEDLLERAERDRGSRKWRPHTILPIRAVNEAIE